MTVHFAASLPSLVIASGGTTSNALDESVIHDAVGFLVASPGTLPETVNIEVSLDGTNYVTLYSNDTDENQTVAPAGKAIYIEAPRAAKKWRLVATAAVAAERTFLVNKDYTT